MAFRGISGCVFGGVGGMHKESSPNSPASGAGAGGVGISCAPDCLAPENPGAIRRLAPFFPLKHNLVVLAFALSQSVWSFPVLPPAQTFDHCVFR